MIKFRISCLSKRGFGMIELLISSVIMAVLMIAIYKYSIKSTKTVSNKARQTATEAKLRMIFNSVSGDLQLAGYNPNDIAVGGVSPFVLKARPAGLSSLEFSFYNSDHPSCTNGPECSTRYYLDSERKLIKTYYDESTSSTKQMIMLNNACVYFLYCDSDLEEDPSTTDCYCSPDSSLNCSDQSIARARVIKLVVATVFDEKDVAGFDAACRHTSLDEGQYARMEKRIFLSNMR